MSLSTRERRPQATRDAVHEVEATQPDSTKVAEPADGRPLEGDERPGTPTVVPIRTAPTKAGGVTVTIRCPWCGRKHVHGVPAGDAAAGHRASHCQRDRWRVGYVIAGGGAA